MKEQKFKTKAIEPLTKDNIEVLLHFLPIFEKEGYIFGEVVVEKGQFPFASLSKDSQEFIRSAYDNNWVVSFDWIAWKDSDEGQHYQSLDALQEADIEALRKVLTTCIRQDRFVEGLMLDLLEQGYITAILRRLKEICEKDYP
jgi:hypothetical protein